MRTKQLLITALDLMRKHGWAQGWFLDCQGHYCPLGALSAVADGLPTREATRLLMQAVLDTGYVKKPWENQDRHTVVGWNDRPGRKFFEVEAVFLQAIKAA